MAYTFQVPCAICGEQWESVLDMRGWEKALFRAGAGCPDCKGDAPDYVDAEELAMDHLSIVVRSGLDGDTPDGQKRWALLEDAHIAAGLGEAHESPKPPAWEPPAPRILWTCAGCDVSAGYMFGDDYVDETERVWLGGKHVHYWCGSASTYGMAYDHDSAEDHDVAPHTLEGKSYCPGCAMGCYGFDDGDDGCSAVIFARSGLDDGDPYASGYSVMNPLNSGKHAALCIDCHERIPTCAYCGEAYDDHDAAFNCCRVECSGEDCDETLDRDDAADWDGDALCPACEETDNKGEDDDQ